MSRRRDRLKAFYRPLVAGLLRLAALVVRLVPRRIALASGEALGRLAGRALPRAGRLVVANMRAALGPALSSAGRYRASRAVFETFGRTLMETLRLPATSDERLLSLVRCEGIERIEAALAHGRGVLILSAHLGAWEVLAAWLAVRFGRPFHAIGRRLYYDAYNDLLVRTRRSAGVETVFQDESPRRALGVLRGNHPLGILADQDIRHLDGVFVEFFGTPAWTPTAPVALARASGAALVPVLITWEGRRHLVRVLPEIELADTRDRRADMVVNTQRWSRAIESVIRKSPAQWAWFHPRWKTRPEGR